MTCSTCGADNPAEARYCRECGIPLGLGEPEPGESAFCPSCRSENPHDAQYCIRCGTDMSAPPLPQGPSAAGPVAGAPQQTGRRLPIRDLGDLVGETFKVYRQSFRAFLLIVFVAQVPLLVAQLIPTSASFLVVYILLIVTAVVLGLVAAGAMAVAVASQYLGREIRVRVCYGLAWARLVSLAASAIVYAVALALSFATIIGIPLSFYLLVRWYFSAQAIMLEGKRGPRQALGRSHQLTRGSWWRLFGIGIVFIILLMVTGSVAIIPGSIASIFSSAVGIVLIALGQSVVLPIGYIGATLVYFDLRARKEGYSLAEMAADADL